MHCVCAFDGTDVFQKQLIVLQTRCTRRRPDDNASRRRQFAQCYRQKENTRRRPTGAAFAARLSITKCLGVVFSPLFIFIFSITTSVCAHVCRSRNALIAATRPQSCVRMCMPVCVCVCVLVRNYIFVPRVPRKQRVRAPIN